MNWTFWKRKKQENREDYSQILKGKVSDLRNNLTGEVTQSALEYDNKKRRFLKLSDDDCALVFHKDQKVEVIFTKLYDPQNQEITTEEQTLMSIAIFLKQPGFAELIRHEFNRIASRNIDQLTKEKEEK